MQSLHGKGVRVIYQPGQPSEFMLSGIESLKEAVARNRKEYSTKVVCFAELKAVSYTHLDVYKRQVFRYIEHQLILFHNGNVHIRQHLLRIAGVGGDKAEVQLPA